MVLCAFDATTTHPCSLHTAPDATPSAPTTCTLLLAAYSLLLVLLVLWCSGLWHECHSCPSCRSTPSPTPTRPVCLILLFHSWITDTYERSKLAPYATDKAFQAKWRDVKQANKAKLAAYIKETFGDDVPLNALFDIQVRSVDGRPVCCMHAALLCPAWPSISPSLSSSPHCHAPLLCPPLTSRSSVFTSTSGS